METQLLEEIMVETGLTEAQIMADYESNIDSEEFEFNTNFDSQNFDGVW